MHTPTHEQIADLAYQLWQQRGCPEGSPEVDWDRAMQVLEMGPGSGNAVLGFAGMRQDDQTLEGDAPRDSEEIRSMPPATRKSPRRSA